MSTIESQVFSEEIKPFWVKHLRESPDLTDPILKHVLNVVSSFMYGTKVFCFPSIAEISKRSSLSTVTVGRKLKKASELGYLIVTKIRLPGKKWAQNLYQAALPRHLLDKVAKGGSEPAKRVSAEYVFGLIESARQRGVAAYRRARRGKRKESNESNEVITKSKGSANKEKEGVEIPEEKCYSELKEEFGSSWMKSWFSGARMKLRKRGANKPSYEMTFSFDTSFKADFLSKNSNERIRKAIRKLIPTGNLEVRYESEQRCIG